MHSRRIVDKPWRQQAPKRLVAEHERGAGRRGGATRSELTAITLWAVSTRSDDSYRGERPGDRFEGMVFSMGGCNCCSSCTGHGCGCCGKC